MCKIREGEREKRERERERKIIQLKRSRWILTWEDYSLLG
jgi:hypothetical protein